MTAGARRICGPGSLAKKCVWIDPGSAKSVTSSLPCRWPSMWSTGNIRMTGSLKPIVTTCRLCAMALPVAGRRARPSSAEFSTSARSATNVSTWESGRDAGLFQVPVVLATDDVSRD